MKRICVFIGAQFGEEKIFLNAAQQLSLALAEKTLS